MEYLTTLKALHIGATVLLLLGALGLATGPSLPAVVAMPRPTASRCAGLWCLSGC